MVKPALHNLFIFQDIPTEAESCVTSLVSDYGRSLLVVGCGDGSVRLFDRRLPPNDSRVMTMRENIRVGLSMSCWREVPQRVLFRQGECLYIYSFVGNKK